MRSFGIASPGASLAAVGLRADRRRAQSTMPKTIRIVVPFSPGGSNDVIARAIAGPLAKRLDVPVIVENKAGAAGVIGADFVAKSPRDGSVLLLTSSSFLTAAATQTQMPYDPIAAFAPVAMVGRGPMLLAVSATTPLQDARGCHRGGAREARRAQLRHRRRRLDRPSHDRAPRRYGEDPDDARAVQGRVERRGRPRAADRFEVMVSNYSTIAPLMKSGKIKALAVTSSTPHPAFPDLPPLADGGAGLRGRDLGRRLRARRHACRHRRPSESGDQCHRRVAGPRAGARARRDRAGSDQRRRVCCAHQGRARTVEADRDRAQDRCRVMRRSGPSFARSLSPIALAGRAGGARDRHDEDAARRAFRSPRTGFDPQAAYDLYSFYGHRRHLRPALRLRLFRASRCGWFPIPPRALPEVTDQGRTYTIKVRPGIRFAADPAFKGKRARADRRGLRLQLEADLRSQGALLLALPLRGQPGRPRRGRSPPRGRAAPSTTMRRSKGCARSTASRCRSGSGGRTSVSNGGSRRTSSRRWRAKWWTPTRTHRTG